MTRLGPALHAGELPDAELQAMRLDGELFALVGAWCPVDVVETPEVRAPAVMARRSDRLVAARRTAAWIWGALPVLDRPIELCTDVRARARLRPGADAVVHEYVLGHGEVVELGGVRVTSPSRTLIDLARGGTVDDDVLRALARTPGVVIRDVMASLENRTLPGRRTARAALERALGQPALTR